LIANIQKQYSNWALDKAQHEALTAQYDLKVGTLIQEELRYKQSEDAVAERLRTQQEVVEESKRARDVMSQQQSLFAGTRQGDQKVPAETQEQMDILGRQLQHLTPAHAQAALAIAAA